MHYFSSIIYADLSNTKHTGATRTEITAQLKYLQNRYKRKWGDRYIVIWDIQVKCPLKVHSLYVKSYSVVLQANLATSLGKL